MYSKDPGLNIEVIMPGQGEQTGLDPDDKCATMTAPPGNDEKEGTELPVRRRVITL